MKYSGIGNDNRTAVKAAGKEKACPPDRGVRRYELPRLAIQNNGITIESELNRCLTDLLREPVEVIGASRTDSGVHALGNIAVFDTTSRMPAEKISYALNQRLPEDIRIQKSEQVPDDWHPRRCDSRKTYEYRIYRAQFPMPVKRLYSLFTYYELDVNRMQEAAAYLEGEHDFKSFCQTGAQVESTVRTIYSVEVEEQGENDLGDPCLW